MAPVSKELPAFAVLGPDGEVVEVKLDIYEARHVVLWKETTFKRDYTIVPCSVQVPE